MYTCFKVGAVLVRRLSFTSKDSCTLISRSNPRVFDEQVPLNTAYSPNQVIAALKHISARCLILSSEICPPYKNPQPTSNLLHSIVGERNEAHDVSSTITSLRHVVVVDNSGGRVDITQLNLTADYAALLRSNQGKRLPTQNRLDADDIISIQFTSGTTSLPKAACLTHRNILNNSFFVGKRMELTECDIVCCPPPLFHAFGLIMGLLAVISHG